MLFDAQAELADILKSQPRVATIATIATNQAIRPPLSQVSRLSQPVPPETRQVVSPSAVPEPVPEDAFRHGRDINGNPKTWTGRIVSFAVWRELSDWDKHGSTGQVWNGRRQAWEPENDANQP